MKKGFIYKIELDNEIYVGSTEQKLCERQSNHNAELKRHPNQKLSRPRIWKRFGSTKLRLGRRVLSTPTHTQSVSDTSYVYHQKMSQNV